MTDSDQKLPQVKELFHALRKGRHICIDDSELYLPLLEHFEEYAALFAQLGFTLRNHRQNFFFFDGEKLGDVAQRIAVFFFILVEYIGDRGSVIEEAIMSKEWRLSELPHLSTERYRNYMQKVGITDDELLQNLIASLEQFGFAISLPSNSFRFRSPAYRLLDLCSDAALNQQAPKSDEGGNIA